MKKTSEPLVLVPFLSCQGKNKKKEGRRRWRGRERMRWYFLSRFAAGQEEECWHNVVSQPFACFFLNWALRSPGIRSRAPGPPSKSWGAFPGISGMTSCTQKARTAAQFLAWKNPCPFPWNFCILARKRLAKILCWFPQLWQFFSALKNFH